MLRLRELVTAMFLLGSAVSTTSGDEVPPRLLHRVGLSGMRVIIVEPGPRWTPWSPPPVYAPYNAVRPQPGIRYYTRPTRNFLNRRITNLP